MARIHLPFQTVNCYERPSASISSSGHSFFSDDPRPIMLYDGVCNLCNGGVNFVLDNDPDGKLRFAALQSKAGKVLLKRVGRSPQDISSVVLVENNRGYIKSEAVLQIAKRLKPPYPALADLLSTLPVFIRDAVYDVVAENRYALFGESNVCRLSDSTFEDRFITEG